MTPCRITTDFGFRVRKPAPSRLTDTDTPDHYCTEAEREAELELPCLASARGEILFLRISDVAHQERQARSGFAEHLLHGRDRRRDLLVDALYVRDIEHCN